MHVSWVTLALQTVNFLVLLALLHRFLWKPVLAALDRRRAEVARVVEEAAAAREAAARHEAELVTAREALGRERDDALGAARALGEEERGRLVAAGRAEADRLLADARAQLARERAEAEAELRDGAGRVAVELAARLLAAAGPVPAARFLELAAARLRELPPHRRRALAAGGGAEVVTAAPLPADERAACAAAIAGALGGAPPLAFSVDPALLGGLELRFPGEVLCCTLREALARAREELSSHDPDRRDHPARRAG